MLLILASRVLLSVALQLNLFLSLKWFVALGYGSLLGKYPLAVFDSMVACTLLIHLMASAHVFVNISLLRFKVFERDVRKKNHAKLGHYASAG